MDDLTPTCPAVTRRLVTAAAAAVAGLLLLVSAPGTSASLSDGASTTVVLRSGSLAGSLQQSGPATVVTGTSTAVVVPAGASGIVPGVQGQRWTYVVTNLGAESSTEPARVVLRLRTSSVATPYAAVQPHLQVAWAQAGGATGTVPPSALAVGGIDHAVELPGTLQPGQSTTITVTVGLPAVSGTTELARSLDAVRSTTVDARTMLTFSNVVTLHQVRR